MKNALSKMNSLLSAALEGAGVPDAQVFYDDERFAFSLGQSGVEVQLVKQGNGAIWRVIEVYDFADLEEGGQRPIGGTVNSFRLGDEVAAAKASVMRLVEIRVDGGLDSVA